MEAYVLDGLVTRLGIKSFYFVLHTHTKVWMYIFVDVYTYHETGTKISKMSYFGTN